MPDHKKLTRIKLLHTAIWVFFVAAIFYVDYSGLTQQITGWTWLCMGAVVGEGLVLAIFKMSCPLTLVARKYSNSQAANFDIYLPEWLAKNNKVIFTTLYLVGAVLVVIPYLRARI